MPEPTFQHACCRKWYEAHKHVTLALKLLETFKATDPRTVAMMGDILERNSPGILLLGTGDKCPCHEAPHPAAYRALCDRLAAVAGTVTAPLNVAALEKMAREVCIERGLLKETDR